MISYKIHLETLKHSFSPFEGPIERVFKLIQNELNAPWTFWLTKFGIVLPLNCSFEKLGLDQSICSRGARTGGAGGAIAFAIFSLKILSVSLLAIHQLYNAKAPPTFHTFRHPFVCICSSGPVKIEKVSKQNILSMYEF